MNKKKYLLKIQSMKETIFSEAIRLSRLLRSHFNWILRIVNFKIVS